MANLPARRAAARKIIGARPTITRLFKQGLTLNKISKEVDVSYKTLQNYMRDWKLIPQRKTTIDQYKEWVINHYLDRTLSVETMAKKLGVTPPTVSNALRNWGVDRNRGFYRRKTEILNNKKDEIINLYVNKKWPAWKIGKKYGLAECTVQLKLTAWGVQARSYTKAIPEKVKKLYDQGLTPDEIGKELGVNTCSIYKTLVEKFGIKHTKKVQFNLHEDLAIKQLIRQGLSVPLANKRFNKTFNRKVSETVFRRRMKELSLKANPAIRKTPRRGNKAYKPEEIERFRRIIELKRKQAIPNRKIADELGISISLVQRIIKQFNIPRVNRVFTPEVKNKIRELYDQGLHYKQIAEQMDLQDDSVRQELTRMGIPRFTSRFSRQYTMQQSMLIDELISKFYKKPYLTSMTKIGHILGIDKTTVKARLKKLGIPIMNSTQLKNARRTMLKPPRRPMVSRVQRKILPMRGRRNPKYSPPSKRIKKLHQLLKNMTKPVTSGKAYMKIHNNGYEVSFQTFKRDLAELRELGLVQAKVNIGGKGTTTLIKKVR